MEGDNDVCMGVMEVYSKMGGGCEIEVSPVCVS